jgi:amidophosphoribosyltransferase
MIYLIDDSIVRGNTLKSVIDKLLKYGVKEIHVRIPSPKIISECYFGIDMATKDELIGYNRTDKEISNIIGATTLKYIEVSSLKRVLNHPICTSCFTGKYNKD